MDKKNIDWNKLEIIYNLARKVGVSFELTYEEPSDEFYGVVNSASPNEETVTRSGDFDTTIKRLKEHLEKYEKN